VFVADARHGRRAGNGGPQAVIACRQQRHHAGPSSILPSRAALLEVDAVEAHERRFSGQPQIAVDVLTNRANATRGQPVDVIHVVTV
jgi:hypothetical protein